MKFITQKANIAFVSAKKGNKRVLAHKMVYWPVAKEISFKDISILALVAMLLSWAKHSDQFW